MDKLSEVSGLTWWKMYVHSALWKKQVPERTVIDGVIHGPLSVSRNLNRTLRTRQLLIDFDAGRPVLSLRAPLDLVNLSSLSRPRWPTECEVIGDIIHHIGKENILNVTWCAQKLVSGINGQWVCLWRAKYIQSENKQMKARFKSWHDLLFWILTHNEMKRVCVVEWDPTEPEPFYQPTGHERKPLPAGEERGKVVYSIDHGNNRGFVWNVLPPHYMMW